MEDKVVLGVHSQISGQQDGSFNEFIDGHSWISVTRNGKTEYYGLWPDNHQDVQDNGSGTDIRVGMEKHATADASRYYELTAKQTQQLEAALKENVAWEYTNTCASWASETAERITGERIEATEFLSIETPRQLIESLRGLERTHPTTSAEPRPAAEAPAKSSSSYATSAPADQRPSYSDDAMFKRLRLDLPAEIDDGRVAYAAYKARQAGIREPDDVAIAMARDGNLYVGGKTPGYVAMVGAGESTPPEARLSQMFDAKVSPTPDAPAQDTAQRTAPSR